MKSKRFEVLAARPVNQDGYVQEWPEVGLIAMNSPFDPKPSIKIENGVITEMDGKCRADFDMLDTFIADHAIRLGNAEKAMAMNSLEIARKIVDINVSREEILDITLSLTPAKLTEVVGKLNIVEIMMGMTKMRARMMPANQCHVTNVRDNPVQIAADAAEAGVRGFAEMETTVAVARYAPFNAMALFVGAQVGRPGVMTQCALEEATELQLGMRGFTTYAETISVYGTEPVFMDGDDTPYANGSNDMPERNVNEDLKAIEDMMARKVTGVDFVKALDRAGFPDVAHNIYNMLRQKVAGDYLHTASIFDEQFHVLSAVNVPNEYHGPMTGYQISEERWNQLKNIPNAIRPEDI